jgi:glycosyltransferase involved in cell wall biosynthesis
VSPERRVIIATILRPDGPTGVQSHVATLLRYLLAQGTRAELVTPYDAPAWMVYPLFALRYLVAPFSRSAGVAWYRTGHRLMLRLALRRRLAGGEPACVYAQCPVSADAAIAARHSPSQPVVMAVHFNVSQADEWVGQRQIASGGLVWRRIRAKETRTLNRVDGLVFVSNFMRRLILDRIPAARDYPTVTIHNFVDDPGVSDVAIRTDLVSVGTLEPRKNQDYLLEVLAAANRRGTRLTLTIIGDGPDRRALEHRARQLGLNTQVTFLGHVAQAGSTLMHYRAYVHSALVENLAIAPVEALSHGKPVFASDIGGMREIFDDGREGRLIPLDDPDEAARILVDALADSSAFAAMSAAARARFLTRFNVNVLARRLHAFLLEPTPAAASSEDAGVGVARYARTGK